MVKIDLKRTGFPVEIGEVELWFDSTIENLKNFANIDQVARERLKEIADKAEHVHFPKEVNEETIKEVEGETIEEAFSISKELVAIQYDIMFGDGAFKKIYAKHPDLFALEESLDIVGEAVAQRLEEEIDKRSDKYNQAKLELLEKKKKKQK